MFRPVKWVKERTVYIPASAKLVLLLKRFASKRKRAVLLVGETNGFIPHGIAEQLGEEFGRDHNLVVLYVGDHRGSNIHQRMPAKVLNIPLSLVASPRIQSFVYSLSRVFRPDYLISIHCGNQDFLKYFEWVGVTVAAFYAGLIVEKPASKKTYDVLLNSSVIILNDRYHEYLSEVECEIIAARGCLTVGDDILRSTERLKTTEFEYAARPDISWLFKELLKRITVAASLRLQAKEGEAIIAASGCFDAALALGSSGKTQGHRHALQSYLRTSRLVAPRNRPGTYKLLRRSMAGFHPLIYASDCITYDDGIDPLAHYIAAGRPAGRWTHKVIRLDGKLEKGAARSPVAVHGHFHYDELFPEFVSRLAANRTNVDLFLTTTNDEKASRLRQACTQVGIGCCEVRVVPNVGRDIGSFLCAFSEADWHPYEIIGHFHGKRSLHRGDAFGAGWRDYLWDHLIGSSTPVLDRIIAEFDLDHDLGLVFPEDPFLHDWDANRSNAEKLARRMGITRELPMHFDFPIGNMFWIRRHVLKILYRLQLSWTDMPPEPLPTDGANLHAIERLLTFAAAEAGLSYATTYSRKHVRD